MTPGQGEVRPLVCFVFSWEAWRDERAPIGVRWRECPVQLLYECVQWFKTKVLK